MVIKTNTQIMDYNKVNNIDIDGNGNITLQDVKGENITLNYNDTEAIKTLLENISSNQTIELKQIVASENKEILKEIRKIQEQIVKQATENRLDEYTADLDDFFKELRMIKIEAVKKRILRDYEILHETEDLYVLEDIPKRKKRYELDIENIKSNIIKGEEELKQIAKEK